MTQLANLRAFLEAAESGSFIAAWKICISVIPPSARLSARWNRKSVRACFIAVVRGRTQRSRSQPVAVRAFDAAVVEPGATHGRGCCSWPATLRAGVQQDLWDVFGTRWFAAMKQIDPGLQLH